MTRFNSFSRFTLCTLILTLFAFVSTALAEERNISKTTLDNGLTVILEEDRSAPVVAFQMWVRVGAADEKAEEAGIAHVFEHMLFKGTKKRGLGEIAREVESSGGSINAYTSYDNTVYHLAVASRHFSTGLDIISDAIQNSAFDPEELKKELQVVLEEQRMGEDNPGRKLYKRLLSSAYTTHPYKDQVIGTEETVSALSRDYILDFFARWYIPNNMTLVIVGDFDPESALKDVKRSFARFKRAPDPHTPRPVEPAQEDIRATFLTQPITQAKLGLAFHIPEQRHPDIYALDMAAEVLGSGINSRLYKRLKIENELVHSISTYAMTPKEPGVFLVTMTLDEENSEEALALITSEILTLAELGPTHGEVQRAELALESSFIHSRESMQGKASQLGYYETISGDLNFEREYIKGIRAVTPESLKNVVKKYLNPESMTITAILPEEDNSNIDAEVVEELVEEAILLARKEDVSQPPTGTEQVTKLRLKNNITLIVKEDHSNQTVALYATFPGGLRFETPETNGIGNFTAAMMTRGTKKRKREELARELDEIAGHVGAFSGKNTAGVTAKFLSRYFEKGLSLFSDVLLNPTFPATEVEKLRKDVLAAIERDQDYLPGYTFKLLYKELHKKHPYGMPTKGSIETVSALTSEDLFAHYRRVFVPEQMVLTIVGDIRSEEAIELAQEAFGDLEREGSSLPELKADEPPSEVISTGDVKDKQQTNIGIGFLGASLDSDDRFPLTLLAEVLSSQGGRLFVELRDTRSLAYAVSAFSRAGVERGIFGLYIGCAPEKKDAAIRGLLDELKKVTIKKVTREELKRAKSAIIGGYEIGLQSVSSQASDMGTNEVLGFGYDFHKEYVKKIEKVTRKDVLKAARKYLTLDRYVISIVGPEVGPKEKTDEETGEPASGEAATGEVPHGH